MTLIVKIGIGVLGVLVLAGGGGFFMMRGSGPVGPVLMGDNFGGLRREALVMLPMGEPAGKAANALTAVGFRCTALHHLIANINAPIVECESAGRGYPRASRIQVTVMARNGMLTDIAIGNGYDTFEADARTPDPNPDGVTLKIPARAAREMSSLSAADATPGSPAGEAARDTGRPRQAG